MPSSARIIAPSRIHFGLLAPDDEADRQFGGAGVMLETPSLEIVVRHADETSTAGHFDQRAEAFIESWRQHTGIQAPVRCDVRSAPAEHVGLGLGTQLGLSIAWALDSLFERDDVSIHERAASVARGQRSAVGTYGFRDGGMVVEDGKSLGDSLGRLRERIALPSDWRVVLVRLDDVSGLAGEAEASAFQELPAISCELKRRLRSELHDRLTPAARDGAFDAFAESVFQYGHAAGECFAATQGGPFLTSSIAGFVQFCREQGVAGVGQSSWGPTVFCWFPDPQAASAFVEGTLARQTNFRADTIVSAVARTGARRIVEPA